MDSKEAVLLGTLESGEGLTLEIAIRITDDEGEAEVVGTDLIDLLSNYVRQYELPAEADDFVARLKANLRR